MATRAATFAAKVRNLHDYQMRLLNSAVSPPSGHDIANTLKYFSQMLLGILKDVPDFPLLMVYNKERDSRRMTLFPSLDYRGLYTVLVQLLEVTPLIQAGVDVLGQSLISTLLCVLPFLEQDLIDNMPSLVASSIVHLPPSLHGYIVQVLCYFLLPLTMGVPVKEGTFSIIEPSIPGIIMAVLQYTSNTAYHCQLMETLMSLKPDVSKDLLCIIAHGTLKARVPGAHLLFYYWPSLNPTLYDRRGVNTKFNGHALNGWKPLTCLRDDCPNNGETADVVKLCLDHRVAVAQCNSDKYGPLLALCAACADEIKRMDPPANLISLAQQPNSNIDPQVELLLPMTQISTTCDNTSCRSSEKAATVSCFSPDCAAYNNQRPIRYCAQCHSIRHNNRRGGDHVFHCNLTSAWDMIPETESYTVEAIVSLLKEAQPYSFERSNDSNDRLTRAGLWLCGDLDTIYSYGLEERRLLSRYGVWLLSATCKPVEEAPKIIIGRLIGALFHWFDTTAHVTDDQAGSVLEPLKSEMLHDWIVEVQQNHLDVLVDCLLPWPASCSRVGGSWDTGHCPKAVHIKEGFNRLFCLVPYEIITVDLWNDVVPRWLEAMVTTVPQDEWIEFRIILSKLLDSEMSPLGFDAQQMFHFLAVRFRGTHLRVQQQTLNWLQLLSSLHITVNIDLLVNIFQEGVTTSKLDEDLPNLDMEEIRALSPASNQSNPFAEMPISIPEKNLACHVLMLDILLEQLEVQEISSNGGLTQSSLAQNSLTLLKDMIHVRQSMIHNCTSADCYMCSLLTSWYQLAQELIAFFSPLHAAVVSECPEEMDTCVEMATAQAVQSPHPVMVEKPLSKSEEKSGIYQQNRPSEGTFQTVYTAKMEVVSELDVAPILPSEMVVRAVAKAVPITEMDVASAKAQVASQPTRLGPDDASSDHSKTERMEDQFWVTSAGKFKFSLEDLPNHLQLIYGFLKELYHLIRPDTQRHLLRCVEILCLHCEVLSKSACKEHPGFLFWVQENLTIAQLWNLLQSQTSHVSQTSVSILLHCLTLPGGSDVFWKIMESDFHSREWKTRFSSVERMVLVCQFLDDPTVKQSSILQSILCNAFCFLISSMDDINTAVSSRATILLESLHDGSLKLLCWCLEQQFDNFIADRPLLLHSIQALHHHQWLAKRKILSWKFFFNRFDALYLEAQLSLQRAGECIDPRDLKSSHVASDAFNKKLQKAREALKRFAPTAGSPTMQPRSLMRSLSLSTHHQRSYARKPGPIHKEKNYNRQTSSAQLKLLRGRVIDRSQQGQASAQEEAYVALFMQRCSELDEYDGETQSLLLATLMQFLAQPDLAQLSDDKFQSQIQNLVLKHLSLLLGYSPTERAFCLTPQKLRCSATFNAFLSALPQVLDRNLAIGTTLLPVTLSLMIFCPAPPSKSVNNSNQHHMTWMQCHGQAGVPITTHGSLGSLGFASAGATSSNNVNDRHNNTPQRAYKPAYSLWYLESHPRRMWLQTVLVILYKYRYNQPTLAPLVLSIVRIVLNTLESQYHRCYGGIGATLSHGHPSTSQHTSSLGALRTREQSQASFDGDNNPLETADVKGRPNVIGHGVGAVLGIAGLVWGSSTIQQQIQLQVASQAKSSAPSRREHTGSVSSEGDLDADVDGIELEVIPESPKSSRPDQDWDRDSLAELEPLSEMSQPEPSNITAASDISIAACVRQQVGVFEAHTVISNRPAEAAAAALNTGAKMRQRKIGVAMAPELPLLEARTSIGADGNNSSAPTSAHYNPGASAQQPNIKQSSLRVGEDVVCHRCPKCNAPYEEFSEEELGLCIVIISTFIHREPTLAASMLPEILRCNSKWAGSTTYTWQNGSNLYVPGEVGSIARQFLRCILHQLTPNKVFAQLFQTQVPDQIKQSFFKTMAVALTDFSELSPAAPLQLLLESLNEQKQLSPTQIALMLPNMACYFECLPLDLGLQLWTPLFSQLEIFCSRLILVLPLLNGNPVQSNALLRLMCSSGRVMSLLSSSRNIMDSFAKMLLYILQHWPRFDYKNLLELCHFSYRNFNKDREKYMLTRVIVDELVSVMRLKSTLPDPTLIFIVQFCLQDAGGTLPPNFLLRDDPNHNKITLDAISSTGAFDCIRPHFNDVVDFLADVHTLSKLKSNSHAMSPSGPGPGLDEDTIGGTIKAGMAQMLALEFVRSNGKDSKCISRFMPWLLNPPSSIQQGPREFLECVCHVRFLSWLLLGALQHTALVTHSHSNGPFSAPCVTSNPCLPLPMEISCSMADHVQGILAGFAEQSKTSVLHMSSLYHAFLLCQLWTIYLEFMASQQALNPEQQTLIFNVLVDFWSKITPSVLQLVAHSSVLTEMVNLHFLSLMEALSECKSTVLSLLLPLWTPVLQAQNSQLQLPAHLQVRLQACVEGIVLNGHISSNGDAVLDSHMDGWLLRWLQKLQFKMGQIEMQSSTASQFYNV